MKRIATYRDYVGELTVTYKRTKQLTKKIDSSRDAADFMRPYFDEIMDDHEEFKIIHLNQANHVVNVHHVSSGSETSTMADVKMIVRNALHLKVQACVAIHNHPSGGLRFSAGDLKTSSKLKRALAYFGIPLLDSMVITREDYISMADEGQLI